MLEHGNLTKLQLPTIKLESHLISWRIAFTRRHLQADWGRRGYGRTPQLAPGPPAAQMCANSAVVGAERPASQATAPLS